jgi:hypothetical protein
MMNLMDRPSTQAMLRSLEDGVQARVTESRLQTLNRTLAEDVSVGRKEQQSHTEIARVLYRSLGTKHH